MGGSNSFGYGINAAGRVVGKSNPLTGDGQTFHAFRTSPNSAINPATDDLGTLGGTTSEADGINADGTTVGWSWIVPGDVFHSHAFVAFPGQRMIDLNTLIDPDSGLTLVNATAINDLGQIVGQATDGTGTTIGYVLTPVPESASLGGLLLCGTAICARRRPDGPGRAKK